MTCSLGRNLEWGDLARVLVEKTPKKERPYGVPSNKKREVMKMKRGIQREKTTAKTVTSTEIEEGKKTANVSGNRELIAVQAARKTTLGRRRKTSEKPTANLITKRSK